jgi:hypothetical protein
MKNRDLHARLWSVSRISGLLLAATLLSGCQLLAQRPAETAAQAAGPGWESVRLAPGTDSLELRTGQVVVTDSGGPAALFFSLFAAEYSPFVHSGIIVMEQDEPWVYETFGRIRPWLGRRPTDLIRGEVTRRSLSDFVTRGKYAEIYDLPADVDGPRVAAYVQEQFARRTPFDPYFRFDEHDAMYCTELSALAWSAGGWQTPPLLAFPDNPSLTRVRQWLGIEDIGTIQSQQLIAPERFVAALSILKQQARFHVYIELKRELHRRFTADQKVGNLFEWNGKNLEFREPVQNFIVQGLEIYRGREVPAVEQVRQDIRTLAVQMFGEIKS